MKFHIIESGKFKLDGGAMFGVVPKVMWNKLNPSDENNLCTWNMRCLLVEHGEKKILFDVGLGDKQDEKFMSHFEPHGMDSLVPSLAAKGFKPEDITDVFITHLHFDHCGGALRYNDEKEIVPVFPNAKYWSNKEHFDWAYNPNPREKASFLKENFVPLRDQGLLNFIPVAQGVQWIENIEVRFYYGHTTSMMVPIIHMEDGKRLIYCADLLPSAYHVKMPYVMSYDIKPMVTLKEKKAFYEEVMRIPETYLFFEHDPKHILGQLRKNDRGRFSIEVVDRVLLDSFK